MTQRNLLKYIKSQLKRGYSADTIREILINAGYSNSEISEAISSLNKPSTSKRGPGVVVAIVLALLIVTFTSIFVLFKIASPGKSIELTLEPTSLQLSQGEPLSFFKKLSSEKERKADVELQHEVISLESSQQITSKSEKLTVKQDSITQTEIPLPDLPPGRYVLQTTLTYGSKKAQRSFSFEVVEEKLEVSEEVYFGEEPSQPIETYDECSLGCDDFNSCTTDICENNECAHVDIIPCCGNGNCEQGESKLTCSMDCSPAKKTDVEIIEEAKRDAISDIQKATTICNSIPNAPVSDECFKEIALSSGYNTVCSSVQGGRTRDDCYIQFAYLNDFSVCSKITNRFLQNSCFSLSRIKQLESQVNAV